MGWFGLGLWRKGCDEGIAGGTCVMAVGCELGRITYVSENALMPATMQNVAVFSSWSVHAISVWNGIILKFSIMLQRFFRF
ncbi:hypothetical protein MRB53_002555 [Persea americana]|uniref:Uncharacterized protein n=1 Tax=Persea americana TaxID=3435 RepID=A0ACC2MX75_PERAE|nr:hypothetical protein MRB53_002555 [Persea americana]